MSLAQITEKIKNDAHREADSILLKAKTEAEIIAKKAVDECDDIQAGFDARFNTERPEIFRRREIVANLDASRMELKAKRDLIEDVFRLAVGKLSALGKEDYLSFCVSLLKEAVKTGDEKISVGKNEKYIDEAWLGEYNAAHGTNLAMSGSRPDINGGFILVRDRTSIDCTWDMLVKVMQEKHEAGVVKRLFPQE